MDININQAQPPTPRPTPAEASSSINRSQSGTKTQNERTIENTATAEPSKEDVKNAVKALNDFVNPYNTSLSFSIDDNSGQTVVKIIDQSTKEIIRQIPSKEALEIASALDKFKGLLIQQKA